jgi:hypothetical protein
MWRLYVGGLCTGFAVGGCALWLAASYVVSESAHANMPSYGLLLLLPFVRAGEALRVAGGKAVRAMRSPAAPGAAPDPARR